VNVGGHPMESVSHGLWNEKRWGGVPSFIKEHQSTNPSLKNLLTFCMEDSKNPIASRWQRQPPLKIQFYLSVLQTKSSSTCLITASLYEGPFFYFYVESPPSTFMHCLREHSCHSEYNVHYPKLSLIDSWLWFHLFLNYLYLVTLLNLKVSYAFMFCSSMKDKLKTICYMFYHIIWTHVWLSLFYFHDLSFVFFFML
jgi:hypothetical protein